MLMKNFALEMKEAITIPGMQFTVSSWKRSIMDFPVKKTISNLLMRQENIP